MFRFALHAGVFATLASPATALGAKQGRPHPMNLDADALRVAMR